jgi:hypothetical protein
MTKRITRPTKAMRADAYRALHAIAIDPESGDSARTSAARALIRDDPQQKAADNAAAKAAAGPPGVLCLPDNGRDNSPLGITWGEGSIMIIYDGGSVQGLADRDRWLAEVRTKIEAEYPTEAPPLQAARVVKPKLTAAERKRIYRAKVKAAKALEMAVEARQADI